MTFRIEDPVWLWLLAGAVPCALVAFYAFTAMSRLRRWSAIVSRAIVLALLAAALAGASSIRRIDRAALIVVADTSGSVRAFVPDVEVGPSGQSDAERTTVLPVLKALPQLLGRAERNGQQDLGADDTVTLFGFDASPRVLTATGRLRDGAATLDRELTPAAGSSEGSDLAGAIRAAAAAVPPDAQSRIVLISDGLAQPARGGSQALSQESPQAAALSAARAAFAATRTPIDVVPLAFGDPREVIVESLDAPTRVASDRAPVPLTLTVTSINPGPVTGTLRLLQEGQEVALPPEVSRLTLQSGRNVLTLRVPLSPGPLHRFEAVFEPDVPGAGERPVDTAVANNRAIAFTTSPGAGRILIVDGTATGASATLAATLTRAGLSVATLTPSALDGASDLLSLQAFDLVVLVDVPAEALSAASQQSLARYVTDTGGGLLMVGGPPPTANSFGAGGWKGTPIEPLLPVTLDLPDRLVMPSTAVVIILDSSGSMAHGVMGSSASQQEIANRGAAAALGALDKQDLVGVVEFNSTASWVVPLRPNDQPQKTAEAIMDISANGGTNLPPALALAYGALQPARAAVKHIIVLSDGRSQGRGRLAGLAKQCKEAPGGPIKISCIAVGDDADTEGLEQLARNAGGEYFRVIDANILPRIFVKAVRVVRTPLVREEPFTPVPGPQSASSPATAGIGALPPLGGLILTQPRLDAQKKNIEGVSYALLTPQGEPLLAHWRAGLGQVGAFTSSPLGGGWAQSWDTPAARAMWVQLARSLARGRNGGSGGEAAEPDLAVRFEGGGGGALRIRVDMPAAEVNAPPPRITVYSPDGVRREAAAVLTAPGVYEASAPAAECGDEGLSIVTVAPTAPGAAPVIGGAVRRSAAADEFRVGSGSAAGTDLLARIARETGGRVLSLADLRNMTASQLFVRDKVEPRESRTPLWPLLVWVAAGVLMLDIATRRIAWDRRSEAVEAEPIRKSAVAGRRNAAAETNTAAASGTEKDSPLVAAKRRARRATDGD